MQTNSALQSFTDVQRDYLLKIVSQASVPGMKAVVFDDFTVRVCSLVFLQSEGFKQDVYLFENIKNLGSEKITSLVGIFVLEKNDATLAKLVPLLKSPVFKEYHLYFTSAVEDEFVKQLAVLDEFDVIKRLQEICLDFLALTPELMTSGLQTAVGLYQLFERGRRPSEEEKRAHPYDRVVKSLTSAVLSLRKKMTVRYLRDSEVCRHLAQDVEKNIREAYSLSPREFDQASQSTLVIVDRKEDPFTPLVFDWCYLSMLNEILHVEDNKVALKAGPQPKTYNLFADEDEFLRQNRYSNYGEVASSIQEFLERVSQKKKSTQDVKSFEDMKKVLDALPEMRRESSNLNKHYELIEEIIKKVKQRKLLEVGEVEQTLLAKDAKGDSFKAIMELSEQGVDTFDFLRLCTLFSLKYEGDSRCGQLLARLRERVGPEQGSALETTQRVLEFGGKARRSVNSASEDFSDLIKKKLQQQFSDIPNVYTQYRPFAETLFENAARGKLKETDFPAAAPDPGSRSVPNPKLRQDAVFLFFVGGVTFAEARVAKELRAKLPDTQLHLGGTHLLHAVNFCADVLKLAPRSGVADPN